MKLFRNVSNDSDMVRVIISDFEKMVADHGLWFELANGISVALWELILLYW